ncbi:MAG: hypothetical protein LKM30_08530 [Bacilli bacterium]|jgi:hypothetical protein|nr:hypothetical protein [Bacilli bacterium]
MNKKITYLGLTGLLLLSGCQKTSSTVNSASDSASVTSASADSSLPSAATSQSTKLTADMLAALRGGLAVNETMTVVTKTSSTYGTTTATYVSLFDYQCLNDEYTFQGYQPVASTATPTRDTLTQSGDIVSQENLAKNATLNINNTIDYATLTDPNTTADMIFKDSGFANPFALLTRALFTRSIDDDHVYISRANTDADTLKLIEAGYGFTGSTDYTLASLSLVISDTAITSYTATYKPVSDATAGTQTSLTVTGTFQTLGDGVTLKPVSPMAASEDTTLSTLFKKLEARNYTEKVEHNTFNESGLAVQASFSAFKLTPTVLESSATNSKTGEHYEVALAEKSGGLQEYSILNGSYYPYLSLQADKALADVLPSFDISPALFDSNDSHTLYTLKKTVPAITPSSRVYSLDSLGAISSLTIAVSASEVVFTNTSSTYQEITTLSDIGTTTVGYADSKVKASASLTWPELLSNQSEAYAKYLLYMKSETVINSLPTLGSDYSLVTFQVSDTYREIKYLMGTDATTATAYVTTWLSSFTTKGWDEPTANIYGGYTSTYTSQITVNDNLKVTPTVDIFLYQLTDKSVVLYLYPSLVA